MIPEVWSCELLAVWMWRIEAADKINRTRLYWLFSFHSDFPQVKVIGLFDKCNHLFPAQLRSCQTKVERPENRYNDRVCYLLVRIPNQHLMIFNPNEVSFHCLVHLGKVKLANCKTRLISTLCLKFVTSDLFGVWALECQCSLTPLRCGHGFSGHIAWYWCLNKFVQPVHKFDHPMFVHVILWKLMEWKLIAESFSKMRADRFKRRKNRDKEEMKTSNRIIFPPQNWGNIHCPLWIPLEV